MITPLENMEKDWELQYWKLMMSEEYEAGFALKEKHFPKSFFKYRCLDKNTLSSLEESYIWLAEIATLNDPFECSLQFDNDKSLRLFFADKKFHDTFKAHYEIGFTDTEIQAIVKSKDPYRLYINICRTKNVFITVSPEKQLETIQKRWSEIIEESNKTITICSFSELNSSLLLWSHYADQHKGISIEYDLIEQDEIRPFLQPIIYSKNVYKIEFFEDLTPLRKIGSTLIKSKDWEYEKEWRATILKNKNFSNKKEVSKPKAVYLGTRFHENSKTFKEQLLKILKEKNIPVYQMKKHPEQYKLITSE